MAQKRVMFDLDPAKAKLNFIIDDEEDLCNCKRSPDCRVVYECKDLTCPNHLLQRYYCMGCNHEGKHPHKVHYLIVNEFLEVLKWFDDTKKEIADFVKSYEV